MPAPFRSVFDSTTASPFALSGSRKYSPPPSFLRAGEPAVEKKRRVERVRHGRPTQIRAAAPARQGDDYRDRVAGKARHGTPPTLARAPRRPGRTRERRNAGLPSRSMADLT